MSLLRKAIPSYSFVLAIAFGLGCLSCGDCVERPTIVSVTPTSVPPGTPDLVLVVNGKDFQRNSSINWNGIPRTTTYISSHELRATISSSDLAVPATVKVAVFSPPQVQPVTFGTTIPNSSGGNAITMNCAGGTSNSHDFAIGP